MTTIYKPLRQDLTYALGEAQSENPFIDAGIAVEVVRAALERQFLGVTVTVEGQAVSGQDFIRQLLRAGA